MGKSGDDSPGFTASLIRFLRSSYAADYVGFALLEAAYIFIQSFGEPVHRLFRLDDQSKQFPHALVQRVSSAQNILYAGILPLGLLILWALLFRPGFHKSHVTILGLFITITLTSFLTDVLKNAIGRPRPDLIARCRPQKGTPEHALVSVDICTETDHHTLHDGWRSFPSGHSSFAFAGLGYFALFLAGQLQVRRRRMGLAELLVVMVPLLGAMLIALSRIADYRHDIYDVTCGSLLGLSVAYLSYRRYYPPLWKSGCETPYSMSDDHISRYSASKVKDEEQGLNAGEFSLEDLTEDEAQAVPLNDLRAPRESQTRDAG